MSKEEIIEDFAQTVFIVTGALFLFFSGFVHSDNFALSLILLLLGLLLIIIRVEYTKDEGVTE